MATCASSADPTAVAEDSPQDTVTVLRAFGKRAPKRVVVVGDSLSTGLGTTAEEAWPSQLSEDLQSAGQSANVINAATNGAGYLTAGEGGSTFGSQIAASLDASTDVVVAFGSDNDAGHNPADLKRAVTKTLETIRARAPQARRILIGPLRSFTASDTAREVIRDQERAAANEAGAVFIDPIEEEWIPGPRSALLGPDGEHPSHAGQQFLKDRIKLILMTG
jgi:lysophospholipase L1-like esterase